MCSNPRDDRTPEEKQRQKRRDAEDWLSRRRSRPDSLWRPLSRLRWRARPVT